jgi:hypothetical protein
MRRGFDRELERVGRRDDAQHRFVDRHAALFGFQQ